ALQEATTVFEPLIRVANRLTVVPNINTKYKAAWPGWDAFEYIPEDVTAAFNNPKAGIQTRDYGEIDALPTGDDDIGLTMTTVRPRAIDLTRAYSMVQQLVAARVASTGVSARPAFAHRYFDPHAETNFMACLEGFAKAGGLYANDRITRVFFWNVEQVSEGGGGGRRRGGGGGGGGGRRRGGGGAGSPGEAKFGWSNEGVFTAAYTLKAQPEPSRDSMLLGTGYDDSPVLDINKRMDWFDIDAATLVA
ncbi:MAG: hypothetical protein M3P49_11000, partial [Actinomycetota bacterium]|nr:hypothetical protein [Actinomycetota bacterium]